MNQPGVVSRSFVVLLSLSMVFPSFSAHAGESCDSMCGLTAQNAKDMITDPTCKNDNTCVECVVNGMSNSQAGAYCGAYNKSNKAKSGQALNAILNTAATVTCGVACAMSMNPATASAEPMWNKVCGFSGLAATAADLAFTVGNLVKGDGDMMSTAVSVIPSAMGAKRSLTILKNAKVMAAAPNAAMGGAKKGILKSLKSPACFNVLMYGIAAASKLASMKKMAKTSDASCMSAKALADSAGGVVQSCLASKVPATTSGGATGGPGLFAATASSYIAPDASAVEKLASTGEMDRNLKQMKNDLQFAVDKGKLDFDKIAKRIHNGDDVSSIMADSGVPAESVAMVKDAEGRMKAGEDSKFLTAMLGEGYTSGNGAAAGGEGSNGEMAFGVNAATPGDGTTSIEVGRNPAEDAAAGIGNDGDVFHAAFGGSIFDIVSYRIKGSKNNYAELEPAGKVNRAFNGYSNTSREPASASPSKKDHQVDQNKSSAH